MHQARQYRQNKMHCHRNPYVGERVAKKGDSQ